MRCRVCVWRSFAFEMEALKPSGRRSLDVTSWRDRLLRGQDGELRLLLRVVLRATLL